MKKIVRLTESDLTRIVKRVIKENEDKFDSDILNRLDDDFTPNFGKNVIDISEVIENGERIERSFFRWLKNNNIDWYQRGSDLRHIYLYDKKNDLPKIKKVWKEVK
jgi:hypothetical protein